MQGRFDLKIKYLFFGFIASLAISGNVALAADNCSKLIATGHPEYPPISYQDGESLAGAAPMLVSAIGEKLNVPTESKYMGSWADAQAATRDGKADLIFGIYYNDERATYLDYVRPAFMFDPVVVMVARGKDLSFTSKEDLIGKKGVTNKGESYGPDFDAFMRDKLTVARSNGVGEAFNDIMSGAADYMIVGLYPGLAEAAKRGIKDKVQALDPPLLSAEMFVAISKKSSCTSLSPAFAQAIKAMSADGSIDKMLADAIVSWDSAQTGK